MPAILKRREIFILGHERVVFSRLADGERCIPFLYIVARGPRNLPRDVWHAYLPFSLCLFISIYVLVRQIDKRGKDSVGPWERGWTKWKKKTGDNLEWEEYCKIIILQKLKIPFRTHLIWVT